MEIYTTDDYLRRADHIEALRVDQCSAWLYERRAEVAARLRTMAADPARKDYIGALDRLALVDYTCWEISRGRA